SSNAFGMAADLMIGASPSPGMTLGLGVQNNLAFSSNLETSDGTPFASGFSYQFLTGPFFDAFPNAKRGFHMGTMIGFAGATVPGGNYGTPIGGGASFWIGYDMWVAPEWSAGFEIRGSGSFMTNSNANAAAGSAFFLVNILNH
ncbi:MAG: hypothetical protein MK135_08880, partial [Polyangiaceae bacterium]|nr:hypothetical protein [Polyangiaceae bacterium]